MSRHRWATLGILLAVGCLLLLVRIRRAQAPRPSPPAREDSAPSPTTRRPERAIPEEETVPPLHPPQQHPRGPWKPTTVPYDPACAQGCQELGQLTPGHVGAEIRLRFNPHVDDPIAQWGACLDDVMTCLEGGGLAVACADAATTCPDLCKSELRARADGLSEKAPQLAMFESVFVQPGAPCRPSEPGSAP